MASDNNRAADLTDSKIIIEGADFSVRSSDKIVFNRHNSELVDRFNTGFSDSYLEGWRNTQSCVAVKLRTNSSSVRFIFEKRPDGNRAVPEPYNGFTVFENEKVIYTGSELDFTVFLSDSSVKSLISLVLPTVWAVNLISVIIEKDKELFNPQLPDREHYLILGDSISHGIGQYCSSLDTFAYKLADFFNLTPYNYAVAGACIGDELIRTLPSDISPGLISFLIGFNNWKYTTTPLNDLMRAYKTVIEQLSNQYPSTPIVLISPLESTDTEGTAPYTLQQMRVQMEDVFKSLKKTKRNLFFIDGSSVSDDSMLDDGVHLSSAGAEKLFGNLKGPISTIVTEFSAS